MAFTLLAIQLISNRSRLHHMNVTYVLICVYGNINTIVAYLSIVVSKMRHGTVNYHFAVLKVSETNNRQICFHCHFSTVVAKIFRKLKSFPFKSYGKQVMQN